MDSSQFERTLLEEAINHPSVAMMRLSLEVDRQLRLILAVTGNLGKYSGQSPSEALDLLAQTAVGSRIPNSLRDTVQSFWDLRNEVVHGGSSREGYAMRSIDYGFRILRMLQSIPRPKFIVVLTTTVYSDKACVNARRDVSGVILLTIGPNGENHGEHIFPTRRTYEPGQSISWEWDMTSQGWDESWYRDPRSGEIKPAWGEALEFVGRPLDEI
jgi:hypothetical protein